MRCQYGEMLSHHTSFKIGGPIFCWAEPNNLNDILESISIAEENRKRFALIGNGSNILAQDTGFDGVVVKLGKGFDYIEKEKDEILRIGAGTLISRLVTKSAEWGIGGCEFLCGIPGSFGGAVFMNAGVRDINDKSLLKEIKDIIIDVDVLDLNDKKIKTIKREEIPFVYRSSGMDNKCILGARIRLEKKKNNVIADTMDAYLKTREWIQRLGFLSAGSVFKNPDTRDSAGNLIERCGLKGARIGRAEISEYHANFIVNTGGAMSRDVMGLIDLAKSSVKERFGILLDLELKVM